MLNTSAKITTAFPFLASLFFLLFLCLTFVGNFVFSSIPAFFYILPLTLAARVLLGLSLKKTELLGFIVGASCLCIIAVFHINDISYYYWSFAFSLLYLFSFSLWQNILPRRSSLIAIACMLSIMIFFALQSLSYGSIRSTLVFGPNVYYRIVGLLCMILILNNQKLKLFTWQLPVFISFGFITLLATGSRGALVIIVFIIAIMIFDATRNPFSKQIKKTRKSLSKQDKKTRGSIFFFMLLFIAYISLNYEFFFNLFWRSFYFSMENASIATRQGFLGEFLDYVRSASVKDFLIGSGFNTRIFSYYPHNLFMEYLVYHGITLFLLSVYYLLILIKAIIKPPLKRCKRDYMALVLAPIFLGSLFSGSMFESYPILSFSFLIMGESLSSVINKSSIKPYH